MTKNKYIHWTDEERHSLQHLIQEQLKSVQPISNMKQKQISWIKIAQILANKTPRQCYDQYLQIQRKTEHTKGD